MACWPRRRRASACGSCSRSLTLVLRALSSRVTGCAWDHGPRARRVAPTTGSPLAEPRSCGSTRRCSRSAACSMQWARRAAEPRRCAPHAAARGLLGGVFAAAFLVGQCTAWRQLQAAGYYAAGNPANAAFYLLTGVHAVHLRRRPRRVDARPRLRHGRAVAGPEAVAAQRRALHRVLALTCCWSGWYCSALLLQT